MKLIKTSRVEEELIAYLRSASRLYSTVKNPDEIKQLDRSLTKMKCPPALIAWLRRTAIKRNGISSTLTLETKRKVRKMYLDFFMDLSSIAKYIGISLNVLTRFIKEEKLLRSKRDVRLVNEAIGRYNLSLSERKQLVAWAKANVLSSPLSRKDKINKLKAAVKQLRKTKKIGE